MKNTPWLGCIADDFTGATDLASFLVKSGMRTVQINNLTVLKDESDNVRDALSQFDAIVVALKSRTAPKATAIAESQAALSALQSLGCGKFYFKYCSTFDSTADGNIGPVTDALLAALDEQSTVVVPALPVNGRTVYNGYLFVFDRLLQESPMRDHPLTPMRDSYLPRLMESQSQGTARVVSHTIVSEGQSALREALVQQKQNANYLIIDTLTMDDLMATGPACDSFKLVTGGSGLATNLCAEFEAHGFARSDAAASVSPLPGPAVILSGSCSAMTQKQVASFSQSHPAKKLSPFALVDGTESVATLVEWIVSQSTSALLYTTAEPSEVQRIHETLGKQKAQQVIEDAFSEVADRCINCGIKNIIVAGGETSGAVVKALAVDAFTIGASIAPGVPMVQSLGEKPINLALKSGNFGDEDFFSHAISLMTK